MEDKVLVAVAVLLVAVLTKYSCLLIAKPKPKPNLPPGPWTLPLIGSIHHLVSTPAVCRAMRDLSRRYGPLMMLRLGEVPTLVVSSPEAAQAIMKTHDITFADRHSSVTMGVLTYDSTDLVFADYGERWRQLRKVSVLELLSAARVRSFRRVREQEVARLMQNLAAGAGAAVDMSKMLTVFTSDLFVRESIGSRCVRQDEYLDAIDTAILHTSGVTLADLFPSSKLMRALGTAPRKVLACRNRITRIISTTSSARRRWPWTAVTRRRTTVSSVSCSGSRKRPACPSPSPMTPSSRSCLQDMFGAGSESSSTTLSWCMTELVRHPAVMARAQAEVREAFKDRIAITEEDLDRAKPRYLKLLIKETLRLHVPLPLLLPRQCREACQVMGYDISKGTAVIVNAWAICRDPKYWDDAEEFKPERFENSSLDYKGTDFEFLPFGSGRRMCPGVNLGVANMELALASLLYHFDWKLPDGIEPKDVDVTEGAGVVAKKKTRLVLIPVTRIAPAS